MILSVDEPVSNVANFFQQNLAGHGLHVVTAGSDASQIVMVSGTGKNAEIEIAPQNDNQTVIRIAYEGE
jgi:hypothetical protein